MAKVKYVGDDYTQFTEVFGTTFPVGKGVEIGHLSEERQATLRGNPMFASVADDAEDDPTPVVIGDPNKPPPALAPVTQGVEIPANWDTLDFMSLKALARKIDPSVPNDAAKDACVEVIEAELGKRAALKVN